MGHQVLFALRSRLTLASVLLVVACGGKGAGGDQPVIQAHVVFPPNQSSTLAAEIHVIGTTSTGADSVSIAGIPADSNDGFLNWGCDVPLAPGLNHLDVVVRTGARVALVDTLRIESTKFFMHRLGGLARGVDGSLLYHGGNVANQVLRSASGDLQYLLLPTGSTAKRVSFDAQRNRIVVGMDLGLTVIDTLSQTIVSTLQLPLPFQLLDDLTLNPSTGEVFVSTRLAAGTSANLYSLDSDGLGLTTISETATSGLPQNLRLSHLDYDAINNFIVAWDPVLQAIIKIEPTSGQRSIVAAGLLFNTEVISIAARDGLNEIELLTKSGERLQVNEVSGLGTLIALPTLPSLVTNSTAPNTVQAANYLGLIYEDSGTMLLVRSDRVVRLFSDGSHELVFRLGRGDRPDLRGEAFRQLAWDSLRHRLVMSNNDKLMSVDPKTGDIELLPGPVAGHAPFTRPIRYDPVRDLIYYIAAPTPSAAGAVYSMPASGGEENLEVPLPEGYQARAVDYDPSTDEYLTALQSQVGGPLSLTLRRSASDGSTLWEHQKVDDPWLSTSQYYVHAGSNSFFGRRLNPDRLFHLTAPGMLASDFAPLGPSGLSSRVAAYVDEQRLEYLIIEENHLRIFDLTTLTAVEVFFTYSNFLLFSTPFPINFETMTRDQHTGLIYLAGSGLIIVVEPESLTWAYVHH